MKYTIAIPSARRVETVRIFNSLPQDQLKFCRLVVPSDEFVQYSQKYNGIC